MRNGGHSQWRLKALHTAANMEVSQELETLWMSLELMYEKRKSHKQFVEGKVVNEHDKNMTFFPSFFLPSQQSTALPLNSYRTTKFIDLTVIC